VADIDPAKHLIHVASSSTGWTSNDIGLAWLEQVFDRYSKPKARLRYRLLIVDGHGSHLTQDFIEYCHQKRIILAVLPPHSTQTLQPLDVVCFKPLSSAYSSELDNHLQQSQGLSPLSKADFFALFWPAWVSTFAENLVLKAFEATGIHPIETALRLGGLRSAKLPTRPTNMLGSSAITVYQRRDMPSRLRSDRLRGNTGGISLTTPKTTRTCSRSLPGTSLHQRIRTLLL
jgi:hypothetical protein